MKKMKTNNPFQLMQISSNTVQVWYGPPGKPESEFIMQVSIDWVPQIIEILSNLVQK